MSRKGVCPGMCLPGGVCLGRMGVYLGSVCLGGCLLGGARPTTVVEGKDPCH